MAEPSLDLPLVPPLEPMLAKAANEIPPGDGWLFELEASSEGLLDCDQYLEHLDAAWEVAQRTIKGQANA